MATRRYKVSVGATSVVEEAGAATNSDTVELTVDLDTGEVNEGASTRAITRDEVFDAMNAIRDHILEKGWPPA